MRRIALTFFSLLATGAFVFFAVGAGSGSHQGKYWVELDNAYDLVKGGDLKIAGVRAGKITDIDVDQRNYKALVGFTISQNGFGSLRSDVFCSERPQSVIGEYYLDCEPGSSPTLLGRTSPDHPIPVTRTSSTVPVDLLQNIQRAPYAQRFTILLDGLGAAVGGNGQNLNDTIRRAVPALRETDQVLGILASQNRILADLTTNADTVLKDWSDNRADVQRWIGSAKGAAQDTAAQKIALEAGLARLPGFLEALRTNLGALGKVADTNTPALRNLNAAAGQLKDFFSNLGPFAQASTPAFAALGKASVTGKQAADAATPTVQQLGTFAQGAPELAQNLSIILQHLDDPAYGVTRDQRAADQNPITHSDTYTGLQSLLLYPFDQGQDTNFFDAYGHHEGVDIFFDFNCDPYADAKAAQDPKLAYCRSYLGPTQPGVNAPDPTHTVTPAQGTSNSVRQPPGSGSPAAGSAPTSPAASGGSGSGTPGAGGVPKKACVLGKCFPVPGAPGGGGPAPSPGSVVQQVTNAVGQATGSPPPATPTVPSGVTTPAPQTPQTPSTGGSQGSGGSQGGGKGGLLNYLLGP